MSSITHMFDNAIAFNQDITAWKGTAATNSQSNIFTGATAFQGQFTCTDVNSGPISSCSIVSEYYLVDFSFFQAVQFCLEEAPSDGKCVNFGLKVRKYGVMSDWDISRVTNMKNLFNFRICRK